MKCRTHQRPNLAFWRAVGGCIALLAGAPPAVAGPLLDLVQTAQATSPSVAAAGQRAAAAAEAAKIARAAREPQITLARSLPLKRTDHATMTTRWLDPTAFAGHRVARAEASVADAALVRIRQDLTTDLVLAVVEQARLAALATIQQERIAQLATERDESRARFDAGLSAITDVYNVEARWMGVRADAAMLVRQHADAVEAVRQLAGISPVAPLRLREALNLPVITGDAAAWTAQAHQANPRLAQSHHTEVVAQRRVPSAQAERLPVVTSSTTKPSRASTSTISLTHPMTRHTLALPATSIVSPGSAVRHARYGVAAAAAAYRIDANALTRETRRLHRQLASVPTRLEASLSSLTAARTAEAATAAGHQLGVRSLIDVLRAQQRSSDARVRATHVRHDAVADWIRARHVLGAADDEALAQLEPIFEIAPVPAQSGGETAGASTSTSATLAAAFDENTMRY